jgi:hypothetical protein
MMFSSSYYVLLRPGIGAQYLSQGRRRKVLQDRTSVKFRRRRRSQNLYMAEFAQNARETGFGKD